MKNKKIVELMLILGVTAGLAGGCTQKTKEQSYVNITETAAENSTEQSQEYLYDENGNQYHYIKTEGYEVKEICNDRQFQDEKAKGTRFISAFMKMLIKKRKVWWKISVPVCGTAGIIMILRFFTVPMHSPDCWKKN
jgi:hypothetical protein